MAKPTPVQHIVRHSRRAPCMMARQQTRAYGRRIVFTNAEHPRTDCPNCKAAEVEMALQEDLDETRPMFIGMDPAYNQVNQLRSHMERVMLKGEFEKDEDAAQVSQVGIWNKVLTEAEIRALMGQR